MNKKGFGPAKLDVSSSDPDAIRGREQENIEKHGGAKSGGGKSGNEYNSVGPRNPNGDKYKKASQKEFGGEKANEKTKTPDRRHRQN